MIKIVGNKQDTGGCYDEICKKTNGGGLQYLIKEEEGTPFLMLMTMDEFRD